MTEIKDRLGHIFTLQHAFDSQLAKERGLDGDMETWIQREVLAIISELGELLDEVNFKWWKNPRPVDRDAVLEELIDILHFYVSMCIKAGFDADDIYRAYLEKNDENFQRQRGLSKKTGYEVAKSQ